MVIVAVFALLALFSLVAVLMSGGEPRNPQVDPYDNPLLWTAIVRR